MKLAKELKREEALQRIIAKLGGNVADAETDIRRWNRGSVWIKPARQRRGSLAVPGPPR